MRFLLDCDFNDLPGPFTQLAYLMLMTSIIPLLPWANVRRLFYNWSALTCFRILSRSISAVVTFHNRELRPKSDGICVANHTTPIDVFILSCDKTYAMVKPRPEWSHIIISICHLFKSQMTKLFRLCTTYLWHLYIIFIYYVKHLSLNAYEHLQSSLTWSPIVICNT